MEITLVFASAYGIVFSLLLPYLSKQLIAYKQNQKSREVFSQNTTLSYVAAGGIHVAFCVACAYFKPVPPPYSS